MSFGADPHTNDVSAEYRRDVGGEMTFVLGMAGGTASGKTTLAKALIEVLGDRALLLTHDRYYHPLPERFHGNPVGHNFDHPNSLDTAQLIADVDALKRGEGVDLPIYDFPVHARSAQVERVASRPIVIVEGILVLADPELRRRFDHSIYVHTPDDIRLSRRIRRDLEKRGRQVHEILDQYDATVRPMHEAFVAPSRDAATTVVYGTEPIADLVASILPLLT